MKLPLALDGLIATGIQVIKKHIFGIKEKHWGVCHAGNNSLSISLGCFINTIT
jgi:hypothetical protein